MDFKEFVKFLSVLLDHNFSNQYVLNCIKVRKRGYRMELIISNCESIEFFVTKFPCEISDDDEGRKFLHLIPQYDLCTSIYSLSRENIENFC